MATLWPSPWSGSLNFTVERSANPWSAPPPPARSGQCLPRHWAGCCWPVPGHGAVLI
ncbi:MAG: hypothetical protein ACLUJG_08705 [Lawsonibacter sp.]